MGIRHALARLLAPDVFKDAERLQWLRAELQDGHRWLGEFRPVAAFIEWLWLNEGNHFRRLDEPPKPEVWRHKIYDFREQLRAQFPNAIEPARPVSQSERS